MTWVAGYCRRCGRGYVVAGDGQAVDTGTCSKRCSRPAKRKRRAERAQLARIDLCEQPKKLAFPTREAAALAAGHAGLYPYRVCPCGRWHLTSRQRKRQQ